MADAKAGKEKTFTITLVENGVHSFQRGLEAYDTYLRSRKPILLKDAIMFLHHGIELLMKEILVRKSEYLIFEDLRQASQKQKNANKLGIGIFYIDNPPRTVTFDEAVNRVEAFVRPAVLDQTLDDNLRKLNDCEINLSIIL